MKDKLKEIGNKYYQECEVVMLTTNKKAIDKPFSTGITLCNDGKLRIGNPVGKSESRNELYFLSNEEIKEGDWCLKWSGGKWIICFIDKFNYKLQSELWNEVVCKKIIATTDTSLKIKTFYEIEGNQEFSLPQLSKEFLQAFIKSYNKGEKIEKVLVEYKKCYNQHVNENYEKFGDLWVSVELKLNSSNEITIKKVKDSWTREEVESAYHYGRLNPVINIPEFNKWVQESL